MEEVKEVPALDFNSGGSGCSTPYITSLSSPKRVVDFYFSAPTSPTHTSAIYSDFNGDSSLIIPYDWEETPGTPKSKKTHNENNNKEDDDDDFAFDLCGNLEKPSLSTADELFANGNIRPLNFPPSLKINNNGIDDSSSPRSPIKQEKNIFREAFSPKQRIDVDPFAAAIEEIRKGTELEQRGREKISASNTRLSRSFSFSHWKEEHRNESSQNQESKKPISSNNATKPILRNWRFKEFLLFPSAVFLKAMSNVGDLKTSSFRSIDSSSSVSSSKRTSLTYKQGLFVACLGFNSTSKEIAKE